MINAMGKMEIPLYHGTSDFFLGKIQEHGLGGYRDSSLFDKGVLSELACKLSDASNPTDWWQHHSFIVTPMLEEGITNGGFNFRHGGTYLTPAKSTACRYATSNRLGSEFIDTVYHAYTALASVNASEAERIVPNNHPLMAAFQNTWKPVVIALNGVDSQILRTEEGETIGDQLAQMGRVREATEGIDPEIIWQQCNFELVSPVEWELLEVSFVSE